jgi:hypothetical protein
MFDNSYFDNSKSDKTDYVQRLEGLLFEKKIDIIESEKEGRAREREREREKERERKRRRENLT